MSRRQYGQQNTRKPHVPQKTVHQQLRGFKDKRDANTGLLRNCVVDPAVDVFATALFLSTLAISLLGNNNAKSALESEESATAQGLFAAKEGVRAKKSESGVALSASGSAAKM